MKLIAVTLFAGLSAAAYAQSGQAVSNLGKDGGAPPPANAIGVGTLTKSDPSRSIPETPAGVEPVVNYPLALAWNDKQKDLTLNYQNPVKRVLTIEGVQASGNLFVIDYPRVIPPEGTGSIKFAFVVQPGVQSDSDVIRLLTSEGIKLLKVSHAREAVYSFSQQRLDWQVGETASTKSVTINLSSGITLTGVRAMLGHDATIKSLGGGNYQISVTPRSTAKPVNFPVFLAFEPEIPGGAPIITCSINAN